MAKLLNRFKVVDELKKMIIEAEQVVVLISPYIKLDNSIKSLLAKHQYKKDFELIIVYGKNEERKEKSLSDEDLAFFKSFQNVTIKYHKALHAKIYGNEEYCLATSMNLHNFSMKNNIEFGILTKRSRIGEFLNIESLDTEIVEFCDFIIEKSETEFKKEVKVKSSFFGLIETKGKAVVVEEKQRYGYCIRTKSKIPYNPQAPYSPEAFQSWNKYQNPNYTEKFCHGCGKENKSTMSKPLCFDCWGK